MIFIIGIATGMLIDLLTVVLLRKKFAQALTILNERCDARR